MSALRDLAAAGVVPGGIVGYGEAAAETPAGSPAASGDADRIAEEETIVETSP